MSEVLGDKGGETRENPWETLTEMQMDQGDEAGARDDGESREGIREFRVEKLTPEDDFEQVADALYLTD